MNRRNTLGGFVAGVALTVLAYPPAGWWPCGLLMLAPAAAMAERGTPRQSFAFTYFYSVTMALLIGQWMLQALSVEYGVPVLSASIFTALIIFPYALIPASAAALYSRLRSRVGVWLAPVLFAALWILFEWLRAEPLGLPWILAAHPLAFVPAAIQTADLGGVPAVGFLATLAGAGIGIAAVQRKPQALLLPALLWLAAGGYAGLRLAAPEQGETLQVGIVQASVPQSERFQPGSALRNTLRHVATTREFTQKEELDLVVWSETAIDDDLDASPGLRKLMTDLIEEVRTPVITGAPRSSGGARRNSIVLYAPGKGLQASYDKQKLVPFAEVDPEWVGFLSPLVKPLVQGPSYVAGQEASLLMSGSAKIATPICFEVTYPNLMRDFQAAGANLIVNLSNDAWFGRTGFPRMHLAHANFRAVELRRWLVRGTNTGISAVIDSRGRVRAELPLFEAAVMEHEVRLEAGDSFYARFGDAPVVSLLALFLLAAVAVSALTERRRASPG